MTKTKAMTYHEASDESRERLLWLVYDQCHNFIQQATEQTVPVNTRIDQLFLCIADLALALAGGYRTNGIRE